MGSEHIERGEAQVHWLVVGPVTPNPTGNRFQVTQDGFAETMQGAGLAATATVRDLLGSGDKATFDVKFGELRDFTLKNIVQNTPLLTDIYALGQALGKPAKPATEEVLAKIESLVGPGKLYDAVANALNPPPEKPEPAGDPADASVDEILSAGVTRTAAKGAVSSFIGAMRKNTSGGIKLSGAKAARRVLEDMPYLVASEILQSPEVSGLEAAWRGLRLMIDRCPSSAKMYVEVIDTTADKAASAIEALPEVDALEEPDVIFVIPPVSGMDAVEELSALAENMMAPLITTADPGLFGADSWQSLPESLEEPGEALEPWTEFTQTEASRWLTMVVNRVALFSEGAGEAKRACFGSGVWALAAMQVASFRDTNSFARCTGRDGSLKAPGMHALEGGPYDGTSIPTEAFWPIKAQDRLAKNGLLGLGSPRNADHVVLANLATCRTSDDAAPLAAQILTGRIVRFASWFKLQLPADIDPKDMGGMFMQAAELFLFPGMDQIAKVRADIGEDDAGAKHLAIHAKVAATHAGQPFAIGFSLPL